ncbi:MAG TPA: S9 family peptidase [Blastocatellia bacterium]|nr:S9 family peptidase [Blastocatellia bacterium]
MTDREVRPYGSWESPITSDLIVSGTIGLGEITIEGDDVYWIESRPSDGGRSVLVRLGADGRTVDVTPAGFNTRTTVHEYGGGAYVVADGEVCFSNFADQQIYHCISRSSPRPLTHVERVRYADGVVDRARKRIICVREDHRAQVRDAINTLVSVDLAGGSATSGGDVVVSGSDFYSSPRLSPDGKRLAWLAWNHPNMPWDGSELWVGDLTTGGKVQRRELVAGGPDESIFQPEWSPDGRLHFVSDRSGWWNLYRFTEGAIEPLCPMEAEFGAPQWVFRMSSYAFESAARIICAFNERGTWRLATLDTTTRRLDRLEVPHAEISNVRAARGKAVYLGGSPTEPSAIVRLDLASGRVDTLRRSTSVDVGSGYLSSARAIEFPTEHGLTAHAFFYRPANRDFTAPADERPPLMVISHGGPTSAATSTLKLGIQFWTSRGIGVLDVNYGGSSGYGRAYRLRLNGNWGVVDVDDCVNGARYLAERGDADGNRLIIRGGSAGGYTTLAALTFRDVFKAGASYYGICDLEVLERDCHKFESRYNASLIGPYPEREELYKARSPIHFTERLSCPIILFQGLEDKVVPPNQAELMFDALRKKGVPVAYIPFEGEQHGFRKAENIKRSLDAELYFYARVFGFEPAGHLEPVRIENL